MVQLILVSNTSVKNWKWLPTNSEVTVPVTERVRKILPIKGRPDEEIMANEASKVNGRHYITSNNGRGVGVVTLRADIPQYRNKVLLIR